MQEFLTYFGWFLLASGLSLVIFSILQRNSKHNIPVMCPSNDCEYCMGERCKVHGYSPCECDNIERHTTNPKIPL